jgi:hypothetical protein
MERIMIRLIVIIVMMLMATAVAAMAIIDDGVLIRDQLGGH